MDHDEEPVEPVPPTLLLDGATPLLSGDPTQIGRYRVIRLLGRGGFGRVYLAHDDQLDRPVAIKLPNLDRISAPNDLEAYLTEAKVLAKLEHPNIVPVHDAGRTDDGLCYVVSKFLEGSDLATKLRDGRPGVRESTELIATVAEALHYAHTRGLVHRDIKPANILIDASGKPCVADFGLALKDEDFGKGAGLAGTPAYMSPEQSRGEAHRVDGRSDIFSLGVVFYELLTARRPFIAESQRELLDRIATADPRPPRQIVDTIPKELERICLKALSKKSSERYTTARDMAEDLRYFLATVAETFVPSVPPVLASPPPGPTQEATPAPTASKPSDSDQRPIKIVPKGLRSFDELDADFFLELLPGPRDRDGLPEGIRFWKALIERTDPDKTFRVGLIYGPSGCGKSSLVKAGLLPRLHTHVQSVYVEATPDDTANRLLKALRKTCPDLPSRMGLVDSLVFVRQGRVLRSGQKVLLVIDQFEQWLHARRGEENTELVLAMRQCDGEHLQALIMVRDDFWMATTRFMDAVEVELLKGQNTAAVDLFDRRHALKVLTAFGTAYGNLPERSDDISRDQHAFLDQAISDLTEDGKVISVRLALFAEMVMGKPWAPATLRDVGGTEGVGVTFLEETFSSPQANPKHRLHQKAAQALLKALLPESGSDIKGQMRSEPDLQTATGYSDRPRDFADLIRTLDGELRLITPTDPKGPGEHQPATSPGERYYQLTHDYLVHSLRNWLTRKQRETRQGRAELRLAEQSSLWNAKPENRHLPSLLEWTSFRLLTTKTEWTDLQSRMMRRAGRVHGLRGLGVAIVTILATLGGIEVYGNLQASALVEALKTADTTRVPALIEELRSYRRWARLPLLAFLSNPMNDNDQQLRASLAGLVLLPDDGRRADYVLDRLLVASPDELPVIWGILRTHRKGTEERLWNFVNDALPDSDPQKRFRAACALAGTNSPQFERGWDAVSPFITDQLLTAVIKNPNEYSTRIKGLRPLRARLLNPLSSVFRDTGRSESERNFAAAILAEYAVDDPELVAGLIMLADTEAYSVLFPVVQNQAHRALPLFQFELDKKLAYPWNDPPLDPSLTEADPTCKGRIESAQGLLDVRFAFCQTMALDEFLTTAETLWKSGYRPVRFRPYADRQAVRVAAVWGRDAREWRIKWGLSPDEVHQYDEKYKNDRFVLVDVAGYVDTDKNGKPLDRYAAVWAQKARPDEEAQVEVGTNGVEHQSTRNRLKASGLTPATVQVLCATDGMHRFCGVWQKLGESDLPPSLEDFDETKLAGELAPHADYTLTDLSVAATVPPLNTKELAASDVNMKGGRPERRYAAVWTSGSRHDVATSHGLDPAAHLQRCRDFRSQGYRIRSVSLVRTGPEEPLVTASVWHRPLVSEDVKDQLAMRQGRAAIALIRLGRPEEVFRLLQHSPDPRLRSFILNWLKPLKANAELIAAEFDRIVPAANPTPAQGQQKMDAILFHRENSIRRALILTLGTFGSDRLSPGDRAPLTAKLLDLYRSDPDAGIHGAAEWALSRWQQQKQLKATQAELSKEKEWHGRRWYVNGQGQTFVIVEGPVRFRMGSPTNELERQAEEISHLQVIPRRFGIAAKEVSVEQYRRFERENEQVGLDRRDRVEYSPEPDGPTTNVSWFEAAAYCNWLSKLEGLPKTDWCYLPNAAGAYAEGMTIPANVLERTGYRLPTEAEWEYACRAGTMTSRYYGRSLDLLSSYAWHLANSQDHTWPVGGLLPNDLGLFDMLGNAYEWCQGPYVPYQPGTEGFVIDSIQINDYMTERNKRVMRGGSFNFRTQQIRSARRNVDAPSYRDFFVGFRPARTFP
jgi:serine/threonine protein kinase/formylglycine-generating enzyme required for sulfatase activity